MANLATKKMFILKVVVVSFQVRVLYAPERPWQNDTEPVSVTEMDGYGDWREMSRYGCSRFLSMSRKAPRGQKSVSKLINPRVVHLIRYQI